MRINAEADSFSDLHLTRAKTFDFFELTKPQLTSFVVFTTLVGFYLGCPRSVPFQRLLYTLIGTALVAGGAGAFNMYMERMRDALMQRTAARPLASGRIKTRQALMFASAASIAGFIYLFFLVNPLTSLLSSIIFVSYLFLYTPLKTKTWLSTLAGAVPGALPIVMGWAGATGELAPEAWPLFLILFLWQLPHFYSIGWMHREDYARAGIRVLSVIDPAGQRTCHQILCSLAALMLCTFLPFRIGMVGPEYLLGAMGLGGAFLVYGIQFARARTNASARRLFIASAVYLPSLLILMMVYKTPAG